MSDITYERENGNKTRFYWLFVFDKSCKTSSDIYLNFIVVYPILFTGSSKFLKFDS